MVQLSYDELRTETEGINQRGVKLMKKNLQRILIMLCVLALAFGVTAGWAEETEARIITIKWSDDNNADQLRPEAITATLGGKNATLNAANGWAYTFVNIWG